MKFSNLFQGLQKQEAQLQMDHYLAFHLIPLLQTRYGMTMVSSDCSKLTLGKGLSSEKMLWSKAQDGVCLSTELLRLLQNILFFSVVKKNHVPFFLMFILDTLKNNQCLFKLARECVVFVVIPLTSFLFKLYNFLRIDLWRLMMLTPISSRAT